jgi:hypothetical protein
MKSSSSSRCTSFSRDDPSAIEPQTDGQDLTSFHGSNSWCPSEESDLHHESAWIEVVSKKAKQDLRKMKRHQQTIPHHRMRTATAVHTPRMHPATAVRMHPRPTPPIQVHPIALEIVQTAIKSAKTDLILNQVMKAMSSEPDACSLRMTVSDVTVPMRSFKFIGTSKYDMEYPKLKCLQPYHFIHLR